RQSGFHSQLGDCQPSSSPSSSPPIWPSSTVPPHALKSRIVKRLWDSVVIFALADKFD
ncbi:hypothetical protein PTTG_30452, partial [Puccinia triticina 1-1 BBBD Race 1]